MNLKELPVSELKALVYDQMVAVENAQNNIKIINAEIVIRTKEVKPEVTPE